MKLKYLLVTFVTLLIASCEATTYTKEEKKAYAAVDSFATYYFNWQFQKAKRFVTDSSQVWLHYAASQVHEADIRILREKDDATIDIDTIDITFPEIPHARITVKNYLRMDTIGTQAHLVDEASFILHLEKSGKEDEDWKVRMEGLPQSERRNRD